jgi:hypothetical protein
VVLVVEEMPGVVLVVELVPVPVVVELLVPGAPVALLSSDSTTNWICPLAGSITRS